MRCAGARSILGLALAAACACSGPGDSQSLTFDVTAPAGTSAVYVSGSIPELGDWSGPMLALSAAGGDRWTGAVELQGEPIGTYVEYKYTRGSWTTVEKGGGCVELPNRQLAIIAPTTAVTDAVATWADLCP
jgi:hypothetical protein